MAEEQSEQLTQAELENLQHLVGTAQSPEGKDNVHSFLKKVVESEDTKKTGNLDETELGSPKLPARTSLELALFCREIANMKYFADYFEKEAEILLGTSLSKDALLVKLAITSNRQIAEIAGLGTPKKKNKGWFGKKN